MIWAPGRARPDDALVADGILGSILAFRGDARAARPLLARCLRDLARGSTSCRWCVDSAAALALARPRTRAIADAAAEHCRAVLERWERSEDHHYAVWGLRVAA